VVLVERNPAAAAICRKNASAVVKAARGVEPPSVSVVTSTVKSYLATAQPAYESFDLAFIDPPYDVGEPELAEVLSALVALLSAEAIVIVERSSRSPEPIWLGGLELERRRAYGETVVYTALRQ
jgi:16S rRNA (guanine966-N2)-methyltransferase